MSLRSIRSLIPAAVAAFYGLFYGAVLIKNIFWSVGDQTDVTRCGLAAFPIGYAMSFVYPGGRTGAFVAVTICAASNAWLLYVVLRRLLGRDNPSQLRILD